MNLSDFRQSVEITNVEFGKLPVMSEKAMARNQGRLCDLAPGEWVMARAGSVNWDSYGEPGARYFTLDTYNDYQKDGITPGYMSFMPIVMRACVTTESGEPLVDYIADLRYMENVTSINRPMAIDPDNPEASYLFNHYRQTRGAVLLKTLLLPGIDGATLSCANPLFEDPALDLAEKVDRLFVKYYGTGGRPQVADYLEGARPDRPDLTM